MLGQDARVAMGFDKGHVGLVCGSGFSGNLCETAEHGHLVGGQGICAGALGSIAWRLAGDQTGLVLVTALAMKMVAYVSLAPFASALASCCRAGLSWLVST